MTHILLQAAGGGGAGLNNLFLFAALILVMYFFFFRPQIKKQKEEKKFSSEIAKGMRVVTSSGIHGKILELGETTIILESENARLKVERSAISKELSAIYLPKEEKAKPKKAEAKK